MSRSPSLSASSVVYDAPLALAQNLEYTRRLDPGYAKAQNLQMAEESRMYTLGPMPVCNFLKDFLPAYGECDTRRLLSSADAFQSVPARAATPEDIYNPLITALNKNTPQSSRCPGFVFVNTAERSLFPRKLGHMKPHICCYTADNASIVKNSDPSSRAELSYAEFFIEIKPDPSDDFFADPPNPGPGKMQEVIDHDFVARSSDSDWNKRHDRALGQHIAYATEIIARQYRHCLFSISLSGSRVRFLRWDRAGCVVSESFDIREHSDVLCDFLWRFSQTSHYDRGYDLTVERASHDEEVLFGEAITAYVKAQLEVEGEELKGAVSEHYQEGHASAIYVADHNNVTAAGTRKFIVSRPVVSPLSLTGRATRGFWAVDSVTRRVVFLKDTWRAGRSYDETEGEALKRMNELGVRHIPSVVHHGDVPDYIPHGDQKCTLLEMQCSMTDEYRTDHWVCKIGTERPNPRKYRHYRIVLGTVGYSLDRFRGTQELLHATYDVFHAIRDAFTKDSRLHRDISVGNIIMVREPSEAIRRGHLIDWESSCRLDSRETGRAGTWFFMSIEVLSPNGLERMHTLQDDMESLLYVILFCSLLWLPHDLSEETLRGTVKYLFELCNLSITRDYLMGGEGKYVNALWRKYTDPVNFSDNIRTWLDTAMDYHSPRRRVGTREKVEDRWSDPEHLDVFWGEFLQTRDLETTDRVTHEHPRATGKHGRGGSRSKSSSTEAIVLGKRTSLERSSVEPAPKRRRTTTVPPIPSPLQAVRRSARLQAQRTRIEPVPSTSKAARPQLTSRTTRRTAGRK